MEQLIERIARLNEIGIALSSVRDSNVICDRILNGAKELTNADGGSLYRLSDKKELKFVIVSTDSLDIHMGGVSGVDIKFPPLQLYKSDGEPNTSMVVTSSVLERHTINIPDAYHAEGYDFSGTRKFDQQTGYRTRSLLTIPMENHEGDIIGVLQLINAIDAESGEVVAFSAQHQQLAESLASQAAVALTNTRLIEEQKELFEAFIKMIAGAIDEKSPYTGGHCRRLPELTLMIADMADKQTSGLLKDFKMTEKDRYELEVAGWLHDCGKVTTPEYVVDKATKLETIYDRINTVDTRFEVLKREAQIDMLNKKLTAIENGDGIDADVIEKDYEQKIKKMDDDRDFIRHNNIGGEFMTEENQQRVREIAQYRWTNPDGRKADLLDKEEVENLIIQRGTLNNEERHVINNHISVTIKMLDQLPFPKHLSNVPEYAGGHHERMDGKGYPRGLTRDQMSIQARMMGIADIFEALTASDRPYKTGKKISECVKILGFMKEDNHIDPDIFEMFIREKIYMQYANEFLPADQIDKVDHSKIPGYAGI